MKTVLSATDRPRSTIIFKRASDIKVITGKVRFAPGPLPPLKRGTGKRYRFHSWRAALKFYMGTKAEKLLDAGHELTIQLSPIREWVITARIIGSPVVVSDQEREA